MTCNDKVPPHSHGIYRGFEQATCRAIIQGQRHTKVEDPENVSLTWVKHLYGLADH